MSETLRQTVLSYDHINTTAAMCRSPHMPEIMAVYRNGFPHGGRTEKEFRDIISLNNDQTIQNKWNQRDGGVLYNYGIGFARDGNRVVGTINYMTLIPSQIKKWEGRYDAAVFIDYRSIAPDVRGQSLADRLADYAYKTADKMLRDIGRLPSDRLSCILPMNESSVPLKMPLGDYLQDIEMVKIDPCNRVRHWQKKGFRRLLPFGRVVPLYVEPAEKPEGGCHYYSHNAIVPDGTALEANTLTEILKPWAGIRFFGGNDPCQHDPYYAQMVANIVEAGHITAVDDRPYLQKLKPALDDLVSFYQANRPGNDILAISMEALLKRHGVNVPEFI